MKIPDGRQRICPGVYYTMHPENRGLGIDIKLTIKWYGYIFLAVKRLRSNKERDVS